MKRIILAYLLLLFSTSVNAQCDGNLPNLTSITYNSITGYYELVFDYKLYASLGCPSAVYGVKVETTGANVISASPASIYGGTQTLNGSEIIWGNWADHSSTPILACDDVIAPSDTSFSITIVLDNYPTAAFIYGETYESTTPVYGTEVVAKGTGKRSIYGCKSEIGIPSESCDASWNKPMFCDATSGSNITNLESFVTGSTSSNWSGTGVSLNGGTGLYEFDATVLAGGSVFVTREAGAGSCALTYELKVDDFDNDLNPVYGNEYGLCSNVPVQMDATVYGSSCEYTLRLHMCKYQTHTR